MIKLGHTLFALPFVLSALCLAYKNGASITLPISIYIILAFCFARAFAMAFNRIVDRKFDAENKRTANRHLVTGQISVATAKFFTLICAILFCATTFFINNLCFYLSFVALFILALYSYTKRFTSLAHFFLGFAIAISPIAVGIALFGSIEFYMIILALGLLFHIAAFDLLYSMQDKDFDEKNHLHSIPSKYGYKTAKKLSALSFALASLAFIYLGINQDFPLYYYIITSVAITLYFCEHLVIKLTRLKNISLVFFEMNVIVSALIFIAIASATLI